MNNIKVLDCTLRDGGYVNNWEFGENNIKNIISQLEKSGVDVLELGFMRDEEYRSDRSIFNSIDRVKEVIGQKNKDILYAVLIEMANYFPPELLAPHSEGAPDLIRYSFWKRKLDEAYDYCQMIKDKGYRLAVQPTRAEQYSDEEFADMCARFSKLDPYAIYIVDTFGLLTKEDVIRYAKIADEYTAPGVRVGYHSHNNMGQAFSNAAAFAELGLKHDIMLDASVFGMGRGAGNLNIEILSNYLNSEFGKTYDLETYCRIWDDVLENIHANIPWGYNMTFFFAAANKCNPNYAIRLLEENVSVTDSRRILEEISGDDKFLFNKELINDKIKAIRQRKVLNL